MISSRAHRFFVHLLLMLIVFQGVGWMGIWKTFHLQARWEAFHSTYRASPTEVQLTLSRHELQGMQVGPTEVIYWGNLYDVRSRKSQGDSVTLLLHHDKKEQLLLSLLKPQLRGSTDWGHTPGSPLTHWAAQWFSHPYELSVNIVWLNFTFLQSNSSFSWHLFLPKPPRKKFFQPPRRGVDWS